MLKRNPKWTDEQYIAYLLHSLILAHRQQDKIIEELKKYGNDAITELMVSIAKMEE